MFRPTDLTQLSCAVALVATTLMLSACGSGGEGAGDIAGHDNDDGSDVFSQPLARRPTPESCEIEDLNNWVYRSMQDYYLFYEQVQKNVRTADYASPEELIRELRVEPDTFSYVADETAYSAFFDEGETFGYGWNFARTGDDKLLFSLIEPNSPLALAGVERSEELVAINGITLENYRRLSATERAEIIGEGEQIKTIELTIGNANMANRVVEVTKATYSLQTVLDTRVFEQNGVDVGYLNFYQFVNTSSEELDQAFAEFQDAAISELVIDLRFNGGGRISVAKEMASHILGQNYRDDVFTTFAYNDKYATRNVSLYFQDMQSKLTLNRVFVLQSSNTCSASELVVNSLRPFMEVLTIGSTSCGKPYATSPSVACGKVTNALEIQLLNAAGLGGYFDGIAADCPVSEDITQPLGETTEPLLAAALGYIDTGSCALTARQSARTGHELTDEFKQSWQGGNSF